MNVREWQELPATEAARELLRRMRALPSAQRRAAIVAEPDEAALVSRFESAAVRGGALAGVPYALKDLFDVADVPTFAGSTFLPQVRPAPQRDGAVVETLRSHGAVLAAKTHLHEFAYGLTGENMHHGDVVHPRFPERTSGGSSSGSAALVAAGVVPFAIGTDTGGSIRVPSAYCGLFGLRLTPHHRWIADAFPLAPSFDTPGWFTASVEDMREVNRAMLGMAAVEVVRPVHGLFVNVDCVAPEVAEACGALVARLGFETSDTGSCGWHEAMTGAGDAFSVLQSTEAYDVHRAWFDERRPQYAPDVWARIDRGRHWLPEQREQAAACAERVCVWWRASFERYEFIALPAAPSEAPNCTGLTAKDRARLLALTAPASLAGLPVLTVPVDLASGLTGGVQFVMRDVDPAKLESLLARVSES